MKKSLIVAGILLVGSTLVAGDVKPFIGIDLSRAEADYTSKLNGTVIYYGNSFSNLSVDGTAKDTAFGFKAGAIIDNKHRGYISYGKYSGDDGKLTNILLNYDYLFKSGNDKITPYIGLHAGQSKIEVNLDDDYEISKTGVAYGLQGGLIYHATTNVDLEIGVSYTMIDAEAKSATVNASLYNGNLTLTNVQITSEVENASRAFIGLNYKF